LKGNLELGVFHANYESINHTFDAFFVTN